MNVRFRAEPSYLATAEIGRFSASGLSARRLPPRLARVLFLSVLTHLVPLCRKRGTRLTRFDSPGAVALSVRNQLFSDFGLQIYDTTGGSCDIGDESPTPGPEAPAKPKTALAVPFSTLRAGVGRWD